MNASVDMGTQLGENFGNNVTYNNISLMNKSGIYTYYEVDDKNSCIIIITSKNLKIIEHILETMTKPKLNVENNPFKLGSVGNSLNISSKNIRHLFCIPIRHTRNKINHLNQAFVLQFRMVIHIH